MIEVQNLLIFTVYFDRIKKTDDIRARDDDISARDMDEWILRSSKNNSTLLSNSKVKRIRVQD